MEKLVAPAPTRVRDHPFQYSRSVGGNFYEHGVPLYFCRRNQRILAESSEGGSGAPNRLDQTSGSLCKISSCKREGQQPARYVFSDFGNEASRFALVEAHASTDFGNVIVQLLARSEDNGQRKVWFGRVGSHANLLNAPSRLQVKDIFELGVFQAPVAWDVVIVSYENTLHRLGRG